MKRYWLLTLFLALLLVACTADEEADGRTITLMTHDSFDVSEEVLEQFESEMGMTVEILPAGDTGTALNQAILAKDEPLADVFYGVDNTFLGRALEADIFQPYASPVLAEIPDEFELDSSQRLLPVDYGDVCLNYDKGYFEEQELALPEDLRDLTRPEYQDLLVVQNPATSSPGLSFLLATIAHFGEEGDYSYVEFWRELRDNGVLVTNDWNEAYYGNFTIAGGNRPLVVSYASSPPAEVVFADPPIEEAPSGVLTIPGSCFRQIEFVGILQGTAQVELAQALVDFMLQETFQEDMPLNMFVFPVNENASLPDVFVEWATIPDESLTLSPEEIQANREGWIRTWSETVLP